MKPSPLPPPAAYKPPKPLPQTSYRYIEYPSRKIICVYTCLPIVVSLFWVLLSALFHREDAIATMLIASMGISFFAMLLYGIPSLITGIIIAKMHLYRHLPDTLKASAIGGMCAAMMTIVFKHDALKWIAIAACTAAIASFIWAWLFLPKSPDEY